MLVGSHYQLLPDQTVCFCQTNSIGAIFLLYITYILEHFKNFYDDNILSLGEVKKLSASSIVMVEICAFQYLEYLKCPQRHCAQILHKISGVCSFILVHSLFCT